MSSVKQFVPPGHFYSPIPSLDEVDRDAERIFSMPKVLHGIEMNDMEQMCLLDQSFRKFYEEMPFEPNQTEGLRYYLDNHSYVYADGIFLYCMLRYLKPKRVIEIGSGSPHV